VPLLHSRGFLPRTASPVPGGAEPPGEADRDRRERQGTVTKYEILLLLDPDLDDARQGEIVTRVREQVESGGGTWDLHDVWGRRRLAYEIGHKTDGTYHLLHFTAEPATLDEIARVLRIDDGVMRHMATRRLEGSPARPVAVGAPARQDAGAGDTELEPPGASSGADQSDAEPETASEVEEEE
jgi:small subunit ribosomal protein S6